MRHFYILLSFFALTACGGGGGSASGGGSPAPIRPSSTVSGTGQLGLLLNAPVKLYDYTNCTKGVEIGTTITDSKGDYTLTLKHVDSPVLIEVGFGSGNYIEEASLSSVRLATLNDGLRTVVNYVSGQTIGASATYWSNLAAGLTSYLHATGTECTAAITTANSRVSTIVGFNILTTKPVDITLATSLSSVVNDGLIYGMHSGGVSQFTYNIGQTVVPMDTVQATWNSIHFATMAYDDISTDGVLNGVGRAGALSFGNAVINADTYRYTLAKAMFQIADSANNKTGLNSAAIFAAAQTFNNSTDAMFGGMPVIPIALAPPSITGVSVAGAKTYTGDTTYYVGTAGATLSGTAASTIGISSVQLLVDGTTVTTSANAAFSFQIVAANYLAGPHTFTVRAFDNAGTSTDAVVSMVTDSAAPSLVFVPEAAGACRGQITWSENYSITNLTVTNVTVTAGNIGSISGITGIIDINFIVNNVPVSNFTVTLVDKVGNTTMRAYFITSNGTSTRGGTIYTCSITG